MKGSLILALLVGVIVLVSGKAKMEQGEHVKESHYSESGEHNEAFDHQSILGSKDEEDEFANLPPEEAKKRLEVIFGKMDKDNDKFVTKDEITAWIMKSYIQMDYDEAKSSFEDYDKDKDGKITWTEYVTKLSGDEVNQEDTDALKETLEGDKLKFDVADVDKDGGLTLEEYAAFQYPYDFEHMHQVEVDMTLQQMDNDKDGFLSFKEFMGEVSTADEKDQIANKENFEEYDKDKDGKLDKKEMEAWIVPGNDDSAADEAGHLIEESDTNGDGKLSKDEVVTKHELWVGSSATSYGKGLHDEL